MAPTIHCVRHAQGYHNLTVQNHGMHDPDLTELGEEQCRRLQHAFPHHDEIDLIVASPLRRTLYTALLGFHDTIQRKGLKVVALPELQETSDLPCDTGSCRGDLGGEFAHEPVDLALVTDGWNCKRGKWAATPQAIQSRARVARQWLKSRAEKNIVVVTHGGFLHYLTKDWADLDSLAGTGWQNTEFRWFHFTGARGDAREHEDEDEEADVEEFPESRARRRAPGPAPSQDERSDLQRTAVHENVPAKRVALNINPPASEERPRVVPAEV